MNRALRTFLSAVLVLCFLMSMVACGGGSDKKASADPIKLTVWISGRDSYIGPDEQKKAQEEWYISKAFKRFEAANPGITVELTVPPDQAEAHQTFKAAGLAKNAPDIANLWTGQNIFALKDVIKPIDKLVPKEDLDNLLGWETVRLDFKPDGTLLGYPTSDVQLCFFLYNKKIIKDAGLDFEANPPKTIQEFDAAMEAIKAKGITPIVTDESFPWFYCYLGVYWWLQMSGRDMILSDSNAKTKFADDKGYLDSLAYYNSLYTKGYVNKNALTSADSWNQFLQGKAALLPNVTSVISDAINAMGEENVGVIKPPDYSASASITNTTIGGPGQCLVVSANSEHPEAAVKLMSFLNSKAEILEFEKVQAKIPTRKDISLEELGWKAGSLPAKLFDWSKTYQYWVDNSIRPGVVDEFYKMTPMVLVGKMTPQGLAEHLDKKAADVAAGK